MRFLITPIQNWNQSSANECWICGSKGANHFHTFWNSSGIQKYWVKIHKHLQNVFMIDFPCPFEAMYICDWTLDGLNHIDEKLLYILLAARKKKLLQDTR